MIAKLIVWGRDRHEAIDRMKTALREFDIVGVDTTLPFQYFILDNSDFRLGRFSTDFVDKHMDEFLANYTPEED